MFCSYIPNCLSSVTSQVEFKIMHHLFCDQHKMELASFPFDEYMELHFEKFILSIIEISPITWSLFGIYILWIYLRYYFLIAMTSCLQNSFSAGKSFLMWWLKRKQRLLDLQFATLCLAASLLSLVSSCFGCLGQSISCISFWI